MFHTSIFYSLILSFSQKHFGTLWHKIEDHVHRMLSVENIRDYIVQSARLIFIEALVDEFPTCPLSGYLDFFVLLTNFRYS